MPAQVLYDPKKSQVNASALGAFQRVQLTGKLNEVSGIEDVCVKLLANEDYGSVTNTYQLIGKFLTVRPDEMDSVDHCQRFYIWLKNKKVNTHRNTIVEAIAERVNVAYPGVYDATKYT